MPGELGSLTPSLMTDAYVRVSVFVAATLLRFYGAERPFRSNICAALQSAKGFQVPTAALPGNAISNDGDALFPAIALNPRAAATATVYSAVPALIVACGLYFQAPGFMN